VNNSGKHKGKKSRGVALSPKAKRERKTGTFAENYCPGVAAKQNVYSKKLDYQRTKQNRGGEGKKKKKSRKEGELKPKKGSREGKSGPANTFNKTGKSENFSRPKAVN